jgi:RND family efflux transporter MFP subunit
MKTELKILAVLILVTSCTHKQEQLTRKEKALNVTVQTVRTTKDGTLLHYSGTVEASQTIPLTFQSTGIVAKVLVEEGDIVKKGQILAVVDKADNQSIYDAAFSKYQQAKDAYDRLKSVHEKGSLTEIKWIEMETGMKQAESVVQLAKSNLEKCTMLAPDNGMIGRRNVEPGQSALMAIAPLELVKIESVFIKVSIPENEINKIHKGLKTSFSISALDGKSYEGEVTNVGIVADRFSRTYRVKINAKNPNLEIKPGMVCDVIIHTSSDRDLVLVPYQAVSKDKDGKSFVFVVSDNKKNVKKQNITTGNYRGSEIEVLGGLIAGQTIVVEGKVKLSDNSLISF